MADIHKHKCEKCGNVWEHDGDKVQGDPFDDAHTCKKCGMTDQTVRMSDIREGVARIAVRLKRLLESI